MTTANETKPEMLKTWKVRTTATGVVLIVNGREFDLGASAASVAFDLERAAVGCNAPETERTAA